MREYNMTAAPPDDRAGAPFSAARLAVLQSSCQNKLGHARDRGNCHSHSGGKTCH